MLHYGQPAYKESQDFTSAIECAGHLRRLMTPLDLSHDDMTDGANDVGRSQVTRSSFGYER